MRGAIGENMGFMEVDEKVDRVCRRVLSDGDWKWQIVNGLKDREWDWCIDVDHECLENNPLEFELV